MSPARRRSLLSRYRLIFAASRSISASRPHSSRSMSSSIIQSVGIIPRSPFVCAKRSLPQSATGVKCRGLRVPALLAAPLRVLRVPQNEPAHLFAAVWTAFHRSVPLSSALSAVYHSRRRVSSVVVYVSQHFLQRH